MITMRHSKGFSLIEIMIATAVLAFVMAGSLSMNTFVIDIYQRISSSVAIETAHSHLEYALLKNYTTCSLSLNGKEDNTNNIPIYIFKDEVYDKYTELKESGVLENINLRITETVRNKGYATLTFNYNNKKLNKKVQKKAKIPVVINNNASGVRYIESCADNETALACPDNASFIVSFDEASFDPVIEYEIPLNAPIKDRLPGKEYIHKSSNLSQNGKGKHCVSYNICVQGDWVPRSLCYDSCRNKFWMDGMLSYETKAGIDNQNRDEDIDKTFSCNAIDFTYHGSTCAGETLQSTHLDKGSYGKQYPDYQPIFNKDGDIKGYFEASFNCTYAGTWQINRAICREKEVTGAGVISYRKVWDLYDSSNDSNNLKCSTNQNLTIESEDKAHSENVSLNKVYPNRRFSIGTPKRLLISFENQPTSATITCDYLTRKWNQVGTSITNCDDISNPDPLVDILFVVDDSGSMSDNQKALSKSIDQFLNRFLNNQARSINYNILVTTTDLGRGYRHFTNKKALKQQSEVDKLRRYLKPGTRGSGHEQPLGVIEQVLKHYSKQPPSSQNFYRKNAHLAVLIITDEVNGEDANHLIDYLIKLKGERDKILVYGAIFNGDPYLNHVISFFSGEASDADDYNGYGKRLANFADHIIRNILILGN